MPGKPEETKKGTELFIPGTGKLLDPVHAYVEKMGLPSQSASAVMKAAQAFQNLKETVAKQQKMTDEQRKALIQSRTALSTAGLKMVDDLVAMVGVPYTTVTVIESKPYVRAEGLRILVQTDPRVIKSVTSKKIRGEWHDNNYIAEFEATVEFWGGDTYTATGSADHNEQQAKREKSYAPVAFVDMIAETRAKRRASREAVSLPVGVAEDVEEGQAPSKSNVTKSVKQTGPAVPENKGQLLAFAMTHYGLKKADLEKILTGDLEFPKLTEKEHFKAAWEAVQKAMVKENGAPGDSSTEGAGTLGEAGEKDKPSES